MSVDMSPSSLERIVAWGTVRTATGRWRSDGLERLYVTQLLRWSLALEVAGAPGGRWNDYSYFGIDGSDGKKLVQAVLSELCEKRILRVDRGRYSLGGATEKAWNGFVDQLWEWLDGQTPDGYPPGW